MKLRGRTLNDMRGGGKYRYACVPPNLGSVPGISQLGMRLAIELFAALSFRDPGDTGDNVKTTRNYKSQTELSEQRLCGQWKPDQLTNAKKNLVQTGVLKIEEGDVWFLDSSVIEPDVIEKPKLPATENKKPSTEVIRLEEAPASEDAVVDVTSTSEPIVAAPQKAMEAKTKEPFYPQPSDKAILESIAKGHEEAWKREQREENNENSGLNFIMNRMS